MGLTPALFTSAKPDGTDPTKLQPSFWNRVTALLSSLFDGADANGSLLYRNTADTTDGASYLPDVATGSVLVSGGVGAAPAWSATPTVTTVLVGDGSNATPSVAIASAPTYGLYFGTNALRWSIAGTQTLTLSSTGLALALDASSVITFGTSADTTITRSAAGKLRITGTTPMLQLGGTTSSFPALKNSGGTLQVRLADDSAFGPFLANSLSFTSGIYPNGANVLISVTAPTISSGFGTSPSIANNNGTAAFTVNVGTGGTASSGVIGLPAATNGWICHVTNITAVAANRADQATRQTASTTTSVTVQNQTLSTGAALAWTAGDILRVSCFAY